jgi:hypothetical protein
MPNKLISQKADASRERIKRPASVLDSTAQHNYGANREDLDEQELLLCNFLDNLKQVVATAVNNKLDDKKLKEDPRSVIDETNHKLKEIDDIFKDFLNWRSRKIQEKHIVEDMVVQIMLLAPTGTFDNIRQLLKD